MKSITYKKLKNKIVIEIPFWSKRSNPYMDDNADVGKYPTLTGMVINHKKNGNDWEEVGFALTIDMDYKDKADQYTDIWFQHDAEPEEFKKLCKKWEIPFVELDE